MRVGCLKARLGYELDISAATATDAVAAKLLELQGENAQRTMRSFGREVIKAKGSDLMNFYVDTIARRQTDSRSHACWVS